MKQITVPASIERLTEVIDFINAELEANDCSMKAMTQIEICVEEVFVNIAHYAYPEAEGWAKVLCAVENGVVTLRFIDGGIPYDPLAKQDPDITLSAEDRQIGGLGIFMVKKAMDSVTYKHEDGMNQLTLEKRL